MKFLFGSIPNELRELVVERSGLQETFRFVKVNKWLKNYVIINGPFHKKKFEKIALRFSNYKTDNNANLPIRIYMRRSITDDLAFETDELTFEMDYALTSSRLLMILHEDEGELPSEKSYLKSFPSKHFFQSLRNFFKGITCCRGFEAAISPCFPEEDVIDFPLKLRIVKNFRAHLSPARILFDKFCPEVTNRIIIGGFVYDPDEKEYFNERVGPMLKNCKVICADWAGEEFAEMVLKNGAESSVVISLDSMEEFSIVMLSFLQREPNEKKRNCEYFIRVICEPYECKEFMKAFSSFTQIPEDSPKFERIVEQFMEFCQREESPSFASLDCPNWKDIECFEDRSINFSILCFNNAIFCCTSPPTR